MRAATAVADKHAVARQALLGVMKERPVILDRSPVWHRYGIMAFRPQLTCGSNIETNVSINKGFGLDHDGDAMQVHVPGTDRAVSAIGEAMQKQNSQSGQEPQKPEDEEPKTE
jgi:DNA-directed RNA polymerase subunit beta'